MTEKSVVVTQRRGDYNSPADNQYLFKQSHEMSELRGLKNDSFDLDLRIPEMKRAQDYYIKPVQFEAIPEVNKNELEQSEAKIIAPPVPMLNFELINIDRNKTVVAPR